MGEDRPAGDGPSVEESEVIGHGSQVIGEALARFRDYLRRVRLGETRCQWPISWWAVPLTGVARVIVEMGVAVGVWLWWAGGTGRADETFPGVGVLSWCLDSLWGGALLGLGLAVLDRVAGAWRRPVRWAVAAAIFPGFLAIVIPCRADWAGLVWRIHTVGLGWALDELGLPAYWQEWVWCLPFAAMPAAWGWWVGRAVPASGRPHGALTLAGLQAGVVLFLAHFVMETLATLTAGPSTLEVSPWTDWWPHSLLDLTRYTSGGVLNGLAIALALWRSRPAGLRGC
jgi:hypothetical protein